MRSVFITGTGTDVGKTIASAVITEALQADYWKPVQAGFAEGTDAKTVADLISNTRSIIHQELFSLKMPASPHIAAREEGRDISLDAIITAHRNITSANDSLVIEGAGGSLVPLNDQYFVADLIKAMDVKTVIVSRHYLGSINHSLLTARVLQSMGITVAGWVFNDHYLDYEDELVRWSGIPAIGSIPFYEHIDKAFIREQALLLTPQLKALL
jgi:dethiobiotin synthetase